MSVEGNIKYGMGQWRYTGISNDYYYNVGNTISKINVSMGLEGDNSYYKDNIITLTSSSSFERNTTYLLSLRIPKHPVYACSYKIKLISNQLDSTEALSDKLSYQLLRYISVPRQNGNTQNVRIIVFKNPELNTSAEPIVSEVVTDTKDIGGTWNNYPYYRIVYLKDDKYYLWKKGTTSDGSPWVDFPSRYEQITNFVDMVVEPAWETQDWDKNDDNNYTFYNIIFSFKGSNDTLNNCNTIWLEMVRNNFDYDIYNTNENDNYYGRDITLTSEDVKIYQLKNLLDNEENIDSLSHIGIYSHPDFIFAINEEELRIGQSGYFELNDYEINSIAVAPINTEVKDNIFTIDYQYFSENNNEESE